MSAKRPCTCTPLPCVHARAVRKTVHTCDVAVQSGCIFLDRDGRHFHDILNFLRVHFLPMHYLAQADHSIVIW